MAKNKNKNKNSKSDAESQQGGASQSQAGAPEASNSAEATGDVKASAAGLAINGAALESMTPEQLREEVLALRQQLQEKDQLVNQLQAQLVAPAKATLATDGKVPDVDQLRARLEALRKEQEEADNARDAAWSQLKKVVGEISKLASPEYVTTLVQKSQSSDNEKPVDATA
jgi:capsule polysaccharide export protein KpsE/RkpR